MRFQRHHIPFVIGILYVAIATIIMLYLAKAGWRGEYQDCVAYAACHCEAFHYDRWVLQPTNTWSNYGFVIVGLLMLWILARDPPIRELKRTGKYAEYKSNVNFMLGNTEHSITFAFVVISCGLTSAYFHASMRAWTNALDVSAMYLFMTFLPIYTITKMSTRPGRWFLIVFIGANTLFVLARVFVFQVYLRLLIFYIFLGVTAFMEIGIYLNRVGKWKAPDWFPLVYRKSTYLFLAMGSFALGYIIWNLWQDGGAFCNPDGIFQGHAVWHFMCALSCWFIFLYLRSEHPIEKKQ
jgi:hypothetical protein